MSSEKFFEFIDSLDIPHPGYSGYTNQGSYDTLEEAINSINSDSKMISLIGVNGPIMGDYPTSEEYSA